MNCAVDYPVFCPPVEAGSSVAVVGIMLFVVVWVVIATILACNSNGKAESKRASRSATPRPIPAKAISQDEELPELAPVAASVSPEVEPPVTAVPVAEPAPAPVVDPTFGWSKPVIDESVLSIPAYIRKAGITSYAAYRRLNPLKTPVVLLSQAREPSPDSMPVFDLGERLLVGFDGQPVH